MLLKRPLDTQQRFVAIGEAIAHLDFLVAAGGADRHAEEERRVRFRPSPGVMQA